MKMDSKAFAFLIKKSGGYYEIWEEATITNYAGGRDANVKCCICKNNKYEFIL